MLVAQALVDGGQRGRRQVLLDVAAEGGDLAVHQRSAPADRFSSGNQTGGCGAAHMLAHRLAVEAQGAGHLGDVVPRLPMS